MEDYESVTSATYESAPYAPPVQPHRMPATVVMPVPQQQAASTSISNYNITLYGSIVFLFFIMTYIAVSYSRDVQNRDVRSKRHNLGAFSEYAFALSERLPNGHAESTTKEDAPESTLEPLKLHKRKKKKRSNAA